MIGLAIGVAFATAMVGCGSGGRQAAGVASGGGTHPAPLPSGDVQASRGVHLALLYSSNLHGEYAHCGCGAHPLGGLVRRATVVERARAEADGVLLVDAGDMLLPPSVVRARQGLAPPPGEVARRARLLLSAYARMGLNALLPAEGDLAIGPGRLAQLAKSAGVPLVGANLVDERGTALFERERLVTIGGISVGIFGVVQALPEDHQLWKQWRVRTTDPTAAARAAVASLKARGADMIVALLHLGPAGAAAKLLEQVPGISWAVQGHSARQTEVPDSVGGAQLVEAMAEGKLAGRLDIHVVDGAGPFAHRGERALLLSILNDHKRQLADIERRSLEDKTDQLRDYYRLRRDGISAAIAREGELIRKLPSALRGSWFENRIIPLDESIADQREVAQLVAAYDAENARRRAARLPVGIAASSR